MDHLLAVELASIRGLGTAFSDYSDHAASAGAEFPCFPVDPSRTSVAAERASELVRSLSTRISGRFQSFAETATIVGQNYQATEEATAAAFASLGRTE